MSRGRRFLIFFASAGVMSAFLFFSLSVREDKPLDKWLQWLPSNKIKAMILDHPTASGQILARPFKYSPEADSALSDLKVNKVEVRHYLRDGNVVLSHDKTKPRENPKQYYIEEEINRKDYFVVVAIYPSYTLVKEFGALAN